MTADPHQPLRDGDRAAFATLERTLQAVQVERAVPVARAFAHFLTLANIAEQHHRIRRQRAYLRDTPGGELRPHARVGRNRASLGVSHCDR